MHSEMYNLEKEEGEYIEESKHSVPSTSSLLLNDTEEFTFDFGNGIEDNDEIIAGDHFTEEEATNNNERNETHDADATTTTTTSTSGRRKENGTSNHETRHAVKPTRIMTREEVIKCMLHALANNPRNFLTLPTVSIKTKRETNRKTEPNTNAITEKGKAKKNMRNKEKESKSEEITNVQMTMADAILQFQAGLRRYDENLWRAQKIGQLTKSKSTGKNSSIKVANSNKQTRQGVKRQRIIK